MKSEAHQQGKVHLAGTKCMHRKKMVINQDILDLSKEIKRVN